MEKNAILEKMCELLRIFPEVQVAYCYGSFLLREDFRDIDIALFLDENLTAEQQESSAEQIGIALEEAISFSHVCDIRVLDGAPVWFQYEVISSGRLLYARSEEERYEKETSALIAYQDMKYTYDLFDSVYLAQA
ncbi:MAG TPA: nucleotidyltransferase [Methanolinea sp.]|nr:nucleotidyltransferase [Methanolinea sp.]